MGLAGHTRQRTRTTIHGIFSMQENNAGGAPARAEKGR